MGKNEANGLILWNTEVHDVVLSSPEKKPQGIHTSLTPILSKERRRVHDQAPGITMISNEPSDKDELLRASSSAPSCRPGELSEDAQLWDAEPQATGFRALASWCISVWMHFITNGPVTLGNPFSSFTACDTLGNAVGKALSCKYVCFCTDLAWRSLWTEEPGRLHSLGSQIVGHNSVSNTFPYHKIRLSLL